MKCRHCGNTLKHKFVELKEQPASNHYLTLEEIEAGKLPPQYPLEVYVCEDCWLVQTKDCATADTFFSSDYAYFSSTSTSWLQHAKDYSNTVIETLNLDSSSLVMEIASNDGYLLQNFVEKQIPCFGVEPTQSTAEASIQKGIPVLQQFFNSDTAKALRTGELGPANFLLPKTKVDLIAANNVLAHVPDINDFVAGIADILADDGTVTFEFPHLLNLIKHHQFDTVYHEHFSYLSLQSVKQILQSVGLSVYKVEELSTHGGSLRVWACQARTNKNIEDSVCYILQRELDFGLSSLDSYLSFQSKVDTTLAKFKKYIDLEKSKGKKIVGYGAAAKANTLLNSAGITSEEIDVIFDSAKSKQNKYMPQSHIPIVSPAQLHDFEFDIVVIFPWNIKQEVHSVLKEQLATTVTYITVIPTLEEFYGED